MASYQLSNKNWGSFMDEVKAMLITIKCEKCGEENKVLLPVYMSKEDWMKTKELLDDPLINLEQVKV